MKHIYYSGYAKKYLPFININWWFYFKNKKLCYFRLFSENVPWRRFNIRIFKLHGTIMWYLKALHYDN